MVSIWRVGLALALALTTRCGENEGPQSPDPGAADQRVDPQVEAQLQALGYVDFVPVAAEDSGKAGVTLHRADRAQAGYSLYNTRSSNQALLIDMDGEVVHRWHNADLGGTWHHIEMLPDGDLLAIEKDGSLARLDWDSNLRWQLVLHAHHDVELRPGGEMYVLDRDVFDASVGLGSLPIVNDAITRVSADGELLEKVYVFDILTDHVRPKLWKAWQSQLPPSDHAVSPLDLMHINSIEYVDRDLAGLSTAGTFLVTSRRLDLVAFVNLDTREPVWSWGEGVLEGPHQPSVMENGNILIFDNGLRRGWSRVIEVDLASGAIVWEYRASPQEAFYTRLRGGAQELANGNILITESDRGRVFEVTREGEIVWEFFNPDLVERRPGRLERGAIYRMTRIEEPVVARLLQR